MKYLMIALFYLTSNVALAKGFQCKDDMRPVDGALTIVTFREDAGKYTVTYLSVTSGYDKTVREEKEIIKSGHCVFTEPFVGACNQGGANSWVSVKAVTEKSLLSLEGRPVTQISNKVVVDAIVSSSENSFQKVISFEVKQCQEL